MFPPTPLNDANEGGSIEPMPNFEAGLEQMQTKEHQIAMFSPIGEGRESTGMQMQE